MRRMKLGILLSMVMLLTSSMQPLPVFADTSQYQPVEVTGFNEDLIADNTDGLSPATSTSISFDACTTGANFVMYAKKFRGPYNTSAAPVCGLPDNGIIDSASNSGVSYQLANYNGNNALLVTALNDEKTLTLSKSGAYEKMLLLASSASGASTFDVILHFSDGTTNSTSFSVPDWFNGSGYAIKGIGRVKRTTDIYGGIAGVFEDSTDNPRLYDCFIDLSAYKTKLLTSISIKKTSSDGRTAILAVAGQKPSGAPETPVLSAANTVSTTGFTVNWDAVSGATDYCLDVAADSNFSSPITGYNNLSVGSVTAYTVTGLAAGTAYYVRVRAGNSNGYSFSSATQTTATLAASVPDVSGSNPSSEDVSGSNPGNTSNAASDSSAGTSQSSSSGSSSSSASSTGSLTTRTVVVNGVDSTAATQVTTVAVTRVISGNKKTDSVVMDKAKADEVLQKVLALGKSTVQVYVDNNGGNPADQINMNVKAASLGDLSATGVNLELKTDDVAIHLDKEDLAAFTKTGTDMFFRIIPVKNQELMTQTADQVKTAGVVLAAAGNKDITVYGTPMTIETNYQNFNAAVTFSLAGIAIPQEASAREAFLDNLGMFIHHDDGTQEIQKGKLVYDTKGNPVGLQVQVSRFSTFTFLSYDGLNQSGYGTHMRLGAVRNRLYADLLAKIYQTSYDTSNIKVEKTGKYYVLYADFKSEKAGNAACQDMIQKKYILHYYLVKK